MDLHFLSPTSYLLTTHLRTNYWPSCPLKTMPLGFYIKPGVLLFLPLPVCIIPWVCFWHITEYLEQICLLLWWNSRSFSWVWQMGSVEHNEKMCICFCSIIFYMLINNCAASRCHIFYRIFACLEKYTDRKVASVTLCLVSRNIQPLLQLNHVQMFVI